ALRSLPSTPCVARLSACLVEVGLRHSRCGALERHEDQSGADAIARPYANRNHPPLYGRAESGGAILIGDHLPRHGRDGSHGTRRYWFPVHATVRHLRGGERDFRCRRHPWHVGHTSISRLRLRGGAFATFRTGNHEKAKPCRRPHGQPSAQMERAGKAEAMSTPSATSSSTTLSCWA